MNCLWRPCLLMDRDKISNHYRPSIDASYQVSVHLIEQFQRGRLKCEKLTDDGRQKTDAKWWQKLTLPLARWAKNTMINRITMETVACLRSKCHLKQNLIRVDRDRSAYLLHFWFPVQSKYTNKKFCRTLGPAYLAVFPVHVIFCPLGPTNFKKSAIVKRNVLWPGKWYLPCLKNGSNS
jgi:hypothetical protein